MFVNASLRTQILTDGTWCAFCFVLQSWTGVPVVAANMDTTGTIATAIELAKHKCLTALNKFLTLEDWVSLKESNPEVLPYVAVSAGTAEYDTELLKSVTKAVPEVNVICLDGEIRPSPIERSPQCMEHSYSHKHKHTRSVILVVTIASALCLTLHAQLQTVTAKALYSMLLVFGHCSPSTCLLPATCVHVSDPHPPPPPPPSSSSSSSSSS